MEGSLRYIKYCAWAGAVSDGRRDPAHSPWPPLGSVAAALTLLRDYRGGRTEGDWVSAEKVGGNGASEGRC